ncbi:substrate-binding domain-containing protein [Ramlibacter sp.]|uniref:helix-turn-helix transcriptional regulator n=1 Tax=Ramlibacter sp. TaxID=1917967 RepID=UPI0018432753|nr:substrate-binding domain-containing protein [Ramlibacter sp.]MBA2674361.1 helix-turn-helix transcriptional regulator [Ramlibacter sp.]
MRQVELSYALSARRDRAPGAIRNALMDLLGAVQAQGSISGAAKAMGLSYRHVWGELRRWEAELGQALIVWDKGQPARLTAFGEKLLWAERQAQARLAPQIEALHAELERVLAVAFDDTAQVLTLYASHDDALSLLRERAAATARLHLDIRFCGSVDAIAALNEGRCAVAGFHVVEPAGDAPRAQAAYQPLLQPGRHKLIGFARRSQGLLVAPGNPLALRTLADVAARSARFANRALGSGTRLLLDELLARAGLTPRDIAGYDDTEPSHSAVAQAIASGTANAGLGIEAAARARGLGFVRLANEHYHLVCLKDVLELPATQALRQWLQGSEWQDELRGLAGYAPWRSGEVLSLRGQLPWWDLPPKKGSQGPVGAQPLTPALSPEGRGRGER